MKSQKERLFKFVVFLPQTFDQLRDQTIRRLLKRWLFAPMLNMGITADSLTNLRGFLGIIEFVILLRYDIVYGPDWPSTFRIALAIIVSVACVTDLLDGPVARVQEERGIPTSGRGAHLDPLYDKLITTPPLVHYIVFGQFWGKVIVCLILAGDVVATLFRQYAAKRGIQISSNAFGRSKMALLAAAILFLVIFPENEYVVLILLTSAMTCGAISFGWHWVCLQYEIELRNESRVGQKNSHSIK